jgi:hypothetical protein
MQTTTKTAGLLNSLQPTKLANLLCASSHASKRVVGLVAMAIVIRRPA